MSILFAISLTPITLAAFFAIDASRATRFEASLQAAADSAALAVLAPISNGGNIDTDVRDVFDANLRESLQGGDLQITEFNVQTTTVDGDSTAAVTATAEFTPLIAGGPFAPSASLEISSTTTLSRASYMDVHFWLDGSGSMHLPADEAGRTRLRQLSGNDTEHRNCAFACHSPTKLAPQDLHYGSSYARAKANGVKLRTDVMRESTDTVIQELSAFNEPIERVRFSIHQFSGAARELAALTSDTGRLSGELDTMVQVNGPYRYTDWISASSNMRDSFQSMALEAPQDGNGRTPASRRQFVVIVSDGMQFQWDHIPGGPIPATACDALKARGVEIAVVHIRYVPMPGDGAFDHYVAPVLSQLGPAMQACASPGYYFPADSQSDIHAAFRNLVSRLVSQLRVKS